MATIGSSSRRSSSWKFLVAAMVLVASLHDAEALSESFYNTTCPNVTSIVSIIVNQLISVNSDFAAGLLRLHFHDCWVRGCEGSILLASTNGSMVEKDANANFLIRGIPEIDHIKAQVEATCPGVVSCADILALAARDAVALVGGQNWSVPLGRRDGVVSLAAEATANLPGPDFGFTALVDNFAIKGFTEREMIVLSGAHTIGRSHCENIDHHFYDFNGIPGFTDPTLNTTFVQQVKQTCPNGNQTGIIFMDDTPNAFDVRYYGNVLGGKGLFSSDAALLTDPNSTLVVQTFARPNSTFFAEFAAAMVKMGRIGVLEGTLGEIRKTCQLIN